MTPPDEGQKTFQGCTCTSSCGASIDDAFNCDWCYVKGSCGHSGITGHYDYCVYPDNSTFEALSFAEKNAYFWKRITADTTRAASYPSKALIVGESIQTSFYDFKDEMPAGRVKGIHTIGAICQFDLNVTAKSSYTGLLGPGVQKGFVRMGGAISWDKSSNGVTPGFGFKFARSGVHSGSYVALNSLDAAVWNFMALNFSNHIGPPTSTATKVLVKKFQQSSQCPSQVGLSDMAKYDQAGKEVSSPQFPFKLFLVPSQAVQRPERPKSIDDVMSELESFKVGTPLMSVYACGRAASGGVENTPTTGGVEKACAEPLLLGTMVTTSACTTSAYGDASFFIRHQPIEEDWQLKPQFLQQYDADAACYWTGPKITPQGGPRKCGS